LSSLRTVGSGFTLLEITVVLFIIGLLLLLAYPKIQALTENSLQSASRRLVGTIQYLYHEAMATHQVRRLSYNLRDGAYQVQATNSTEASITPVSIGGWVRLPQGVSFQDVVTLRQGKVTEGEAFTQFFPAGLVEKTVIHLTDQDQHVFTLDINPLSGRVKVYEGYIEVKEAPHREE
jgi:general secretion pathway protein H